MTSTLRERYSLEIKKASGSVYHDRVKLTSARIEAMKADLAFMLDARRRLTSNYRKTRQARAAAAFAGWCIRQGYRVRVTFPDGPLASVYVRVAGKVIRFSDHQPTHQRWNGGDVGGYCRRLGRRHFPADASICIRNRFTFADARAALEA